MRVLSDKINYKIGKGIYIPCGLTKGEIKLIEELKNSNTANLQSYTNLELAYRLM